jgi:hypothetical protein
LTLKQSPAFAWLTNRKAKAPSEQAQLVPARINLRSFPSCTGVTGIRRADEKVALYLLDGLAYDPEPLGAVARQ